jgi:hypothetical protein
MVSSKTMENRHRKKCRVPIMMAAAFLALLSPIAARADGNLAQVSAGISAGETYDSCAVSGDYLYVGATSGLRIYDIKDPGKPKLVGTLSLAERLRRNLGNRAAFFHVERVAVEGSAVFLSFVNHGIVKVDVSDPTAPVALEFGFGNASTRLVFWQKFLAHAGDMWYVYRQGRGILAYDKDMNEAGATVTVGKPFEYQATSSHAGGYLYFGDASARTISVYSTEDPKRPRLISSVATGECSSVLAAPPFLYAVARYGAPGAGLWVYDISKPEKPITLVSKFGQGAEDIAAKGSWLYICDQQSLRVVNLANTKSPKLVTRLAAPGLCSGWARTGSIVCISTSTQLRTVDITDPGSPTLKGTIAIPAGGIVAARNGFAYVKNASAIAEGLIAIDVRNPSAPALTWKSAPLGEGPIIAADDLFFSFDAGAFSIYSLADPARPTLAGSGRSTGAKRFLAAEFQDGLLYCEGLRGTRYFLAIFDIRDPKAPRQLSSVDLAEVSSVERGDITVREGRAYVLCGNAGVFLVDVADPQAPAITRRVEGADKKSLGDADLALMRVYGDRLYVGAWYGHLLGINLAEGVPSGAPEYFPLDVGVLGMLSEGRFLYVLSTDAGLIAYRTGATFDTMYVATNTGLNFSSDGGTSWSTFTAPGAPRTTVAGVAVAGSTICAATEAGLAMSLDHGSSWTMATSAQGLAHNVVRCVHADGATIYAGTQGGLSISTDRGASWKTYGVAQGFARPYVEGIYADGSTIYAATWSGGLAISTNGGASWAVRTPSDGLGSWDVRGVYAVGSSIYAGTRAGLSISTDAGKSFKNYSTAQGLAGDFVQSVLVRGSTIYAATENGLSISEDSGANWRTVSTAQGLPRVSIMGIYEFGGNVYAATFGSGVAVSSDNGATWTNFTVMNHLPSDWVHDIAAGK